MCSDFDIDLAMFPRYLESSCDYVAGAVRCRRYYEAVAGPLV